MTLAKHSRVWKRAENLLKGLTVLSIIDAWDIALLEVEWEDYLDNLTLEMTEEGTKADPRKYVEKLETSWAVIKEKIENIYNKYQEYIFNDENCIGIGC